MTSAPKPPTAEEMLACWREDSDTLEQVSDEVTGTNRHGTNNRLIVHRESDDTHWAVDYQNNPGGDHNTLRDGDVDDRAVYQVEPVSITVIKYRRLKGNDQRT